ncbi:MAG: ribonucleoside-diphosphate reductase subunit alpha, partial [Abyssibacter sp.]
MQTEASNLSKDTTPRAPAAARETQTSQPELSATAPGSYKVIRRNGKVTPFDASKVEVALTKAFLAVEGGGAAASARVHEKVRSLAQQVAQAVTRNLSGGGTVHIEDIQDQVELALMRSGEHKVARAYVIYRAERARERDVAKSAELPLGQSALRVTNALGQMVPLDEMRLRRVVTEACEGIDDVNGEKVIEDTLKNAYDGIKENELATALTLCARTLIENEPNYSQVAARLLLDNLRHEAMAFLDLANAYPTHGEMRGLYGEYFKAYLHRAAELELVDPMLCQYDLDKIGDALLPDRDNQFTFLGLQTLYDRYFIHSDNTRFELPQAFYMRVAMGLAINEIDREDRAIEFYQLLSSFDFMSSTPTLFNSGTLRPQLSSCYLTTVPDDLGGIYGAIHDNAMLSKFAGGLGNDWTPVRALG